MTLENCALMLVISQCEAARDFERQAWSDLRRGWEDFRADVSDLAMDFERQADSVARDRHPDFSVISNGGYSYCDCDHSACIC